MMLKKLRQKKTAKKVWIILALIITPAFVLWGSGSLLRSKQEIRFAGKIFGRKVPLSEFQEALEACRNQAIIQFGENFNQVQKYLNLEEQAWERLILLQEAKKRRISVSDQEVVGLIQSYPFFQKKGVFDQGIYADFLRYYFHTPARSFEEQTRQNLMLAKLFKELTADLKVNDEEIRDEYRKLNVEISIDYLAALEIEFQKETLKITEEELKSYFAKNSFAFKQPLSFNAEYLMSDSEEKIKNIFLRLQKKETLTKIAKDLNLEAKETGLFASSDSIPGIGWVPEVSRILAKLKEGEFSPPLSLDKKFYLFKLKERKEPYIPDFESSKEKVKQTFVQDKARELSRQKIAKCLEKIKESAKINPDSVDFRPWARECGLKSGAAGPFKYGSYIEGIGASDNFWLEAERLKENELSHIIEMPGGFYVIKVKSRPALDEKKFESEKKEFRQKLLAHKHQEYFLKFVEELKRKAKVF